MLDEFGISRVTEITRLDRVGVPVYVSIRPLAQPGSLCVNAGKGLIPLEAEVGACMEAVEFAMAEYGRSPVRAVEATARAVLDGRQRPEAILDFCPLMGAKIALDEPMACVEAEDVLSSSVCLVPAELVFMPLPHELAHRAYFGANSNGLAAGNTVLEATVHAIAEVIERDIRSFLSIRDTSKVVTPDTLVGSPSRLWAAVEAAGLRLALLSAENAFSLPYFTAVVWDPSVLDPMYVSGGYGCHPWKEIAATRAICEALQSRLSFIHGGRDDLVERYDRFVSMDDSERAAYARGIVGALTNGRERVDFGQLLDRSQDAPTVEAAFHLLSRAVRNIAGDRILRVTYAAEQDGIAVVRVLIPRLEFFTSSAPRVGRRLRDHVRSGS